MPGAPLTHYFQWNISGSNLALLYERSHTILHILFFLEDIFLSSDIYETKKAEKT